MNLKKSLLQTITMGAILIGTVSIASISQASTAKTPKQLKIDIPTYRLSTGNSYVAGGVGAKNNNNGQSMWKIYEYNANGKTVPNYNNAIYCLKWGPGFGSANGSTARTELTPYEIYADMKNPKVSAEEKINDATIINKYKETLPEVKEEHYNSLVWVLDHCYVPAPSNQPEKKPEALANKKQLLENAKIPSTSKLYADEPIMDDLIDIIQQLSIWYFTNGSEYKKDLTTLVVNTAKEPNGNKNLEDINRAYWDLNDELQMLYQYFKVNGEANKNTKPNSSVTTNPIQLKSNTAKVVLAEQYYIAGPYKIENVSDKAYTIEGMLIAADNTEMQYTLLDSNKQETTKTLKELGNEGFYLKIPATQNIEGAKFKVITKVKQNTITYWEVKNPQNDQPVVEIIPEEVVFEEEVSLTLVNFDLALRKFITKINYEPVVPSREPVITEEAIEALKNGETEKYRTAIKEHTKKPRQVAIGDVVLYTIRIYNEGDLDGYATEITDYLPEGLTLKPNSTINNTYGWTNPSGDGKTIVTTKLANTLLPKFNGTKIEYADVEVECIVNAPITESAQSLKNIAEITKDADENGDEITDRDSVPGNLTEEEKQNYNPGESEKGWGYEDDDDYEELILPGKYFDLALRKFITNINGKELMQKDGTYVREPRIDLTPLIDGSDTTAIYRHPKEPIRVSVGDIVIYTLRVYNEGEVDGYASSITDYLPPQLEFINDEFNAKYGWTIDSTGRIATTRILEKPSIDPEDTLIKAFDGTTLDYKEVKIKCKVVQPEDLSKVITNIAEVTEYSDKNGNTNIIDRDSTADSLTNDNSKPEDDIVNDNLPADKDLPDYKGHPNNKSVLTDAEYFYRGQQDDDDFEKLILEEFDLALRKFITKVNETPVTDRIPVFTHVKDENGNYIYEHTKEPIEVSSTDIVEYTIRIYNEGDIAGYAKEVKDNIPEGLEFLPNHETNIEYRWIMLDENGNETDDVSKAKYITTDYLAKEQEKTPGSNLIGAFDSTKTSPDYKEVKVAFKVVALNSYEGIITNIAEISDDSDEEGNPVEDKDSTPDNDDEKEDDIDKEHIKLSYFDLALRKFITAVNSTEITNRIPVFKIDENGNYVYEHTKEPVEVENGNIVTYTLRIYNEGTKDGYAKEIKDDLPEGLEFLPENETNKEYRWVMIDENGEETQDISKAVSIKTDYLSKEQEDATGRDNLLTKFNPKTMEEPNYKEVKIAFKVTEPNTSDRILINKAQISDDSDKNGNEVIDKDSTPDKWIEGEDDQDIEKVKVKYFDLSLRKWVTQAIVIDNGKETVTETGHKAEDDPEEVVKVEIKENRLNKVVVKFRYKIRVKNEGEIPGYATEISDYIPQGLKFVAADNPNWKEVDGKVVTDALKDTLLQPGDTAEVEILLTWINAKDNFNLKINTAEISKDKNDSDTPDIDSTPNNKVPGEDDIDDAPVILTIKTGARENTEYMTLVIGTLGILASSVILIKKYVL